MDASVMIIDMSSSLRAEIDGALRRDLGISKIFHMDNGRSALSALMAEPVDLLVTDLILPSLDGMSLIEELSNMPGTSRPKIIVLTALANDLLIGGAMRAGIDFYMLKPFDPTALCQRIAEFLPGEPFFAPQPAVVRKRHEGSSLDEHISHTLLAAGVPAHMQGYLYMREAIKLVVNDRDVINRITKELYPAVAHRFNSTPSKVERSIRHAIEVTWNRQKFQGVNGMLGPDIFTMMDRPTNGEWIALLADRLTMRHTA